MAITTGTLGAAISGTTSLNVVLPAGIDAGDLIIISVGGRFSDVSAPAGWYKLVTASGGLGSEAADSGVVTGAIFVKEALDTSDASSTVVITGTNSTTLTARSTFLNKAADKAWTFMTDTAQDTVAGTSWSTTFANSPPVAPGDKVLVMNIANTDAYGISANSITATDASFTGGFVTMSQASSNGNDVHTYGLITNVSASISNPITYSATYSGSTAVAPTGPALLVRFREGPKRKVSIVN